MMMMMMMIRREVWEFRDGLVPVKPLGAPCWTSFYKIRRNSMFTLHLGNPLDFTCLSGWNVQDIFSLVWDEDEDVDEEAVENQKRQIGARWVQHSFGYLSWQTHYFGHLQIIPQPNTNQIKETWISQLWLLPKVAKAQADQRMSLPKGPEWMFWLFSWVVPYRL